MLIGFAGRMGMGKTLSMTILCQYMYYRSGVKLYSNYTLQNAKTLTRFSQMWEINDGVIALDEIWLSMDSRAWKDNVAISRWINQTRKKNTVVMYTTQHIGQVDIRVRRATDIVVSCTKTGNGTHELTFVDYQYGLIGRKFRIENAQRFYPLYNTYEVLQPMKADMKQ